MKHLLSYETLSAYTEENGPVEFGVRVKPGVAFVEENLHVYYNVDFKPDMTIYYWPVKQYSYVQSAGTQSGQTKYVYVTDTTAYSNFLNDIKTQYNARRLLDGFNGAGIVAYFTDTDETRTMDLGELDSSWYNTTAVSQTWTYIQDVYLMNWIAINQRGREVKPDITLFLEDYGDYLVKGDAADFMGHGDESDTIWYWKAKYCDKYLVDENIDNSAGFYIPQFRTFIEDLRTYYQAEIETSAKTWYAPGASSSQEELAYESRMFVVKYVTENERATTPITGTGVTEEVYNQYVSSGATEDVYITGFGYFDKQGKMVSLDPSPLQPTYPDYLFEGDPRDIYG